MQKCDEVRVSPAGYYMNCQAYQSGKNCWEVLDISCCKRKDKNRDRECDI